MSKDKKEGKIVAITLDQAEMAVRIVEGLTETERPEGMTARQALESLTDDNIDGLFRASRAVAEYVYEQIVASGVEDAQFLDHKATGMN